MGQRARSTYHTSHLPAEGKEPKSTDLDRETKHVAYLRVKDTSSCVVRSTNGTKQGASQTSEASALTCTDIHNLRSASYEEFRASGLFSSLMKDINLWIAAYKKLAPNPGSHEGGAGGDGTSMKSLEASRPKENALVSLQAQSAAIRTSPPNCWTRSVEVMRTILETVCEPRFLKCSNSGEPGYSQHTCMKQIRRDFRGAAVWYIEGRRSKCFDTIDHQMSLLHKKIQDDRFLTLVRRHLYKIKRPLIRSVALSKDDHIGRPFGPLLSNVVLHELEKFVMRLKSIADRGSSIERATAAGCGKKGSLRRSGGDRRAAFKTRLRPSRSARQSHFRRIHYVRYADDFLIGVIGPRALADRIRSLVARFLEVRLSLRPFFSKTLITRAKGSHGPAFLGFLISSSSRLSHFVAFEYRRTYNGKSRIVRVQRAGHVTLLVDMRKVIHRLAALGFCDKSGNPKPNFFYFQDPQRNSVSRISGLLRGLANYYHIADSKRQCIARLSYILRHSLAMVYAAKFKLRSRAKVFAIAGKDLKKPRNGWFSTRFRNPDSQLAPFTLSSHISS
jgi:nicotine oxidoreductase|uniref:Putative reverse transcriptase and intron maturase n=1 Tax=Chara vulgaris TaxID=55564 RepID=Q7YAJ5_CHAVU|nr:putative reverse transcriptase and intron maturase [Chara vulgaris]AAP92211.1 putative reverse transcriptase and intron maturase [Chara vulgaris]